MTHPGLPWPSCEEFLYKIKRHLNFDVPRHELSGGPIAINGRGS